MLREIFVDILIFVCLFGIAVGRLPLLRMNRAALAFAGAAALILVGALTPRQAFEAVDLETLALILALMVIAANLRISGFFTWASERVLLLARTPRGLLAAVVGVSGVFSALFLNDTMCLVLTPLVAELAVSSRRDPVPYLVGVATAANVGSCATIIGNPQNMLIGASSGISFGSFFLKLALPSAAGLAVCWIVILLAFPGEFRRGLFLASGPVVIRTPENPALFRKSVAAAVLMVAALAAGMPTITAALLAAAFLLVSRRTKSERIFAEIDFSLLVFFAGLFIITRAIEGTGLFRGAVQAALPAASRSPWAFSGASLALSNLVSNVPAVMLLRPMIPAFPNPEKAWLLLALSSTFAGNLTLLGSVANLIVAEGAKRSGIELSFGKYLRAGLPITAITAALGTAWLAAAA
jgi:Na+/H+ antiporter NhaD/arsenite permease-like protein